MFRSFRWSSTSMVVVGVATVALASGSALTAAISAPDTNAGQAVETVDGFTVTGVEYNTDGTNTNVALPLVDDVTFTIVRVDQTGLAVVPKSPVSPDVQNAEVFVQLRVGGTNSTWIECVDVSAASNEVTCDTTSNAVKMGDIDGISVVAYDLKTAS